MKKDNVLKSSMLFQMEEWKTNCKVNYSLNSNSYGFKSSIADMINLNCKVILSNYKSIKTNDIIELHFHILSTIIDEEYNPTAIGEFCMIDKELCCLLFVPKSFPERLAFILNLDIKPYFYLNCERLKYQKPTVKSFNMLNKIVLEDYLPI